MFDHFFFTPDGDVYEPDGYSLAVSRAVTTLTVGSSPEYAARKLSVVRRYLNRLEPGADPRGAIEESAEAAVDRIKGLLRDLGYHVVPCAKANREREFEILVPHDRSTAHAQQVVAILRQFHQLCGSYGVGSRTVENPVEMPGWHTKTEEARRESWCARFPKRPYGWMSAGLRFRPTQRKPYLPLIEDPAGCGQAMTRAVTAYGCPCSVIAICIVLEENGCRWREAAWVNALGWSIKGFGEIVFTTNKFDDGEHAKRIVLRPDVLSDAIRGFEGRPHPAEPGRTMMDHLRELVASGDRDALRAIPLFPNSRGTRHLHATFNGHWFRPAMEAWGNEDGSAGLLIFSDIGSRRPTPHWYRHAEITRQLEAELDGRRTEADILEMCRAVCRRFGLKTDQAKRYAASLMKRVAEEAQMRAVAGRRAELAAERAGVDIPPALPRQTLSEAERLMLALPARRTVTA